MCWRGWIVEEGEVEAVGDVDEGNERGRSRVVVAVLGAGGAYAKVGVRMLEGWMYALATAAAHLACLLSPWRTRRMMLDVPCHRGLHRSRGSPNHLGRPQWCVVEVSTGLRRVMTLPLQVPLRTKSFWWAYAGDDAGVDAEMLSLLLLLLRGSSSWD